MIPDDYAVLKAADVRAGVLADPAQASTAIRALQDTVTLPVTANDIRTILWATFEYGALEQLLDEGKAGNFANYPAALPDAAKRQMLVALRTTFSFLNSGTLVMADDEPHWQAIMTQLGQLVGAGMLQASTRDAIGAKRTKTVPVIDFPFDEADLGAARNYA